MSETLRDRRLRYAQMILQSRRSASALLGETSDLDGLRVLVLGTASAETLDALMHTECRTAEARLPDAYSERHAADLVLVPHVTLATLGRVVDQAARSLAPGGRIVIAASPRERDFVEQTIRLLLRCGFAMPHLQAENGEIRIHAARGDIAGSS